MTYRVVGTRMPMKKNRIIVPEVRLLLLAILGLGAACRRGNDDAAASQSAVTETRTAHPAHEANHPAPTTTGASDRKRAPEPAAFPTSMTFSECADKPSLGGVGMCWSYAVRLSNTGSAREATIEVDGYQTMERLVARVIEKDGALVLAFDRCGKDDQFGCAAYKGKKGATLARIERESTGRPAFVFSAMKSNLETERLPMDEAEVTK